MVLRTSKDVITEGIEKFPLWIGNPEQVSSLEGLVSIPEGRTLADGKDFVDSQTVEITLDQVAVLEFPHNMLASPEEAPLLATHLS